ncbi:MAG: hypothetical protein IT361_01500 [Gemmatimonadaceae bacterium]|nr:hypothetical protein [Gemmatimonadaceae bacterium]
MTSVGQKEEMHVTTIEVEGRPYSVSIEVENDGIEHVGYLWFTDDEWDDDGLRDHGAIPGHSSEEVLHAARAISPTDLQLRFARARQDQRRYHGLRRLTEQVLEDIRHLNKVATSMRVGLLEVTDAAEEIDRTEQRLHELIDQLRVVAGVVSQPGN